MHVWIIKNALNNNNTHEWGWLHRARITGNEIIYKHLSLDSLTIN